MATVDQSNDWSNVFTSEDPILGKQDSIDTIYQSQALDVQPLMFLQNMVNQVQLLACLKWLGESQVLTLIPLRGDISMTEVSDLAGVPRSQLSRIVRLTATAGFMLEPQPGRVAHTPLSAPFVTSFSLLDAALFLAESAAPTALRMSACTDDCDPYGALSSTLNTPGFAAACASNPRLQRQWAAYRQCAGEGNEIFVEVLKRLNWRSMGAATIVIIAAQTTDDARTLSRLHPSLRFVVQLQSKDSPGNENSDSDARRVSIHGNITVQSRATAGKQNVRDAAVYILRPDILGSALKQQVQAELNTHLSILRGNLSASIILSPPLLPEPGSVDLQTEITARVRDLHKMQLTNESDMELSELIELVHGVRDDAGGLVVVNKIPYSNGTVAAVSVKYKYRGDHSMTR